MFIFVYFSPRRIPRERCSTFFLVFGDSNHSIPKRCKGVHCVDLGESFPTSILFAKFGFDTAVNEPCKVCPLSAYRSPRFPRRDLGRSLLHVGRELDGGTTDRFEVLVRSRSLLPSLRSRSALGFVDADFRDQMLITAPLKSLAEIYRAHGIIRLLRKCEKSSRAPSRLFFLR